MSINTNLNNLPINELEDFLKTNGLKVVLEDGKITKTVEEKELEEEKDR